MSTIDVEEMLLDTMSTKFSRSPLFLCVILQCYVNTIQVVLYCLRHYGLDLAPIHADFYNEGIEPENPDQIKRQPFLMF